MNKSNKLLFGIVLLVVGMGLAFWGYQMADSLESQINNFVKGAPTTEVMVLYIGGAVCIVAGLFFIAKR